MREHTPLDAVRKAYDRWSGLYDDYDNPMVAAASEVVAGLGPLARGRDVVELGCGTGRNLLALGAAGAASVTGCDASAGMLAAARAKAPVLALIAADIGEPLPLRDGVADLVLFCLVLEHVAQLGPPLAAARRLLRPGGVAAVVEIHPDLAAQGVGAHFRDGDDIVHMPTFAHRLDDYRRAGRDAGLSAVRERGWTPADFRRPHPKMAKRDPAMPFVIELLLARAADGMAQG